MTDFLQAAQDLINRGFSVIPIEPRGKRPFKGWGVTKRVGHLQYIDTFESVPVDCNIGICADENVVILETDDLERLSESIKLGCGRELPTTLSACGSSENRPHFFFARTERSTNVGNLAVPGLFEARFQNQYVVAPPSLHPSGAIYRFLNTAPIVPIPDWLVSELARLGLSQTRLDGKRVEIGGGRVPEGSRHYFLMRELGRLHTGKLSEDEMIEKGLELNALCDPPKDTAHVIQCVRDIMRRDPFDPGPTVLIGSGQPRIPTEVPASATPTAAPEWTAQTARELKAAKYEERKPLLEEMGSPLFYERSVNQIVAWRGVGKTMFALGLAGALAAGGQILDFTAPTAKRVLYVDGELPLAQLQERANALVPTEALDRLFIFNPEMIEPPLGLNLLNQGEAAALGRLVDKHKIEVLILDSQSTLMLGDTLKNDFQERRQQLLRQLRWNDLCIIEMHHLGKEGRQRGSSKNDDILDVQMMLNRLPDWEPEDGLIFEVTYEKVRHAARLDSGYTVSFTDGKWHKTKTDLVQQVADLLRRNKSERDICKELDITKGRVGRLKKKAIAAGLVELNDKTNKKGE